jgi:hypothetical protein
VGGGRRRGAATLLAGFGAMLLLASLALPWFSLHSYFRTDDVIERYDALLGNSFPSLDDRLPGVGRVLEVALTAAAAVAVVATAASDVTGHRSRRVAATIAGCGAATLLLLLVATVAALHTGRPGPGVLSIRARPLPGVAAAWLCAAAVSAGGVLDLRLPRAGERTGVSRGRRGARRRRPDPAGRPPPG